MATLHATVTGIHGVTTPAGPVQDASGNDVIGMFIEVTFTGTYAQAGNADVLLTPAAIESFMHWGRTLTLLQACFAAPGDEAGTPIGAGECTITTTTIAFQLNGGDLITEHANAVLGVMNTPIQLYVTALASVP